MNILPGPCFKTGLKELHSIYNNGKIEIVFAGSVRGSFPQRLNENIALREIIFFEFFINDWGYPHMNNFSTFRLENCVHLITISGRNGDTVNHTKHCSNFQQSPFDNFRAGRCSESCRRSQLIEIITTEKSSKHCCCLLMYRTQDGCRNRLLLLLLLLLPPPNTR